MRNKSTQIPIQSSHQRTPLIILMTPRVPITTGDRSEVLISTINMVSRSPGDVLEPPNDDFWMITNDLPMTVNMYVVGSSRLPRDWLPIVFGSIGISLNTSSMEQADIGKYGGGHNLSSDVRWLVAWLILFVEYKQWFNISPSRKIMTVLRRMLEVSSAAHASRSLSWSWAYPQRTSPLLSIYSFLTFLLFDVFFRDRY